MSGEGLKNGLLEMLAPRFKGGGARYKVAHLAFMSHLGSR